MAANESYHTSACVSSPLTHSQQTTLEIIRNLTTRRGYCFAHNAALASMRCVHEATIGRHIKALREQGFILVVFVGSDRRIFVPKMRRQCVPSAQPLPLPTDTHSETTTAPAPKTGPMGPKSSRPVVASVHEEPEQEPEQQAVNKLIAEGVSAPKAAALVKEKGEKACLLQVEALARRSNVRDAAAYLVAAIKGDWGLPVRAKPARVYYVRRERPQETPEAGPLDVKSMLRGLKSFACRTHQKDCGPVPPADIRLA